MSSALSFYCLTSECSGQDIYSILFYWKMLQAFLPTITAFAFESDGCERCGLLRSGPRRVPIRERCIGQCGDGGRGVHAERAGDQHQCRPGQGDGRRRVHLQPSGAPVWVQGSYRFGKQGCYCQRIQTVRFTNIHWCSLSEDAFQTYKCIR